MDFWNSDPGFDDPQSAAWQVHAACARAYPVVLLMLGSAVPIFYPQVLNDWPHYEFPRRMILRVRRLGAVATASAPLAQDQKSSIRRSTFSPHAAHALNSRRQDARRASFRFSRRRLCPIAVFCWAVGGTDIVTLILLYHQPAALRLLCAPPLTMRSSYATTSVSIPSACCRYRAGWRPLISTLSMGCRFD